MTRPAVSLSLALGLLGLVAVVPGCKGAGRYGPAYGRDISTCSSSYAVEARPSGNMFAEARAAAMAISSQGEEALRGLPWGPDVFKANLAVNGPVALTQ